MSRYRGRFAPSPTGPLHFGSLIAALASYCDARANDGAWLVRVEDVDAPRARPGAERLILGILERYGFAWDGPVVRQRERRSLYEAALAALIAEDRAYPCACTRRDLAFAPTGVGGERIYPGNCREGIRADRLQRAATAWRVRVDDRRIAYHDRVFAERAQVLSRDVGDFIVKRADGLFAYQLAVVVDDAEQGITDIVRGADLAASTPRQILLQELLGYPHPSYLHVPVAVTADGQKLSKQTFASPLPADPLPALIEAWRFLRQPEPAVPWRPATVDEFWSWAHSAWTPSRTPAMDTIPAPAAFQGNAPAAV